MAVTPTNRRSLLSSSARIQVPWVKVTLGNYTFGIFTKTTREHATDTNNFYTAYNVQYPNYIQSLQVTKINGQINQYTLSISYPVTLEDDPNFFEKVLSSVSASRKIVFSYGDASMPAYTYKDEEAMITKVDQGFNFGQNGTMNSVITYRIYATSTSALGLSGCYTFVNSGKKKPSDEIKRIFRNPTYGLSNLFSGMRSSDLDAFIDGGDKAVEMQTKTNISALDYITYLVSCMVPDTNTTGNISPDIYILTVHDDTTYDRMYSDRPIVNGVEISGPYFKVKRTSYVTNKSDAYEIDIGYNTSTIVTNFQVNNNESYALYYDYQGLLNQKQYVRRINNNGVLEDVYAPGITSKNENYVTNPEDVTWWTKITKYPISATVTIQGLLRPATLMSYVRLNVIFPGGKMHTSSGLYIVTQQVDEISTSGYRTTLSLTKLDGADSMKLN